MAKNPLASSEAILRAARQSQRLVDELTGNSAVLAAERLFSVRDEQIAALARTQVPDLGWQGPAFLASQRLGERLAAEDRMIRSMVGLPETARVAAEYRAMIELPEAARIAAEAVSPRLRVLAAAEAALLDSNHAAFLRSTEMLNSLVESAARLPDLNWAAQSGLQATVEAVRLNQEHINSIVGRLATATIADLEPGEAKGLATAFGEAVALATGAPNRDEVVLEVFRETMRQAVRDRLPAQNVSGPAVLSLERLIALLALLIAVASWYQDRQGGKADAKNTEAITSRQDEGNDLLRRSLEEWLERAADTARGTRVVDRDAHVYKRPAKGAAVRLDRPGAGVEIPPRSVPGITLG